MPETTAIIALVFSVLSCASLVKNLLTRPRDKEPILRAEYEKDLAIRTEQVGELRVRCSKIEAENESCRDDRRDISEKVMEAINGLKVEIARLATAFEHTFKPPKSEEEQ